MPEISSVGGLVPVTPIKKDGSKRFCIDSHGLNKVTIRDAFPVPRIDELLDVLGGAYWFSVLNLKSGFWQVEIALKFQRLS